MCDHVRFRVFHEIALQKTSIMYYPKRLLELVLYYFIIWVLVIELHLLVKIHWTLHRSFVHIISVTLQSNVYLNRKQKLRGEEEQYIPEFAHEMSHTAVMKKEQEFTCLLANTGSENRCEFKMWFAMHFRNQFTFIWASGHFRCPWGKTRIYSSVVI